MSVRKAFVKFLHAEMKKNEKVVLVLGDLGYGHFDAIREPNSYCLEWLVEWQWKV